MILFRYSQPALIRQTIQFATATAADVVPVADLEMRGYWLVFSAVTIYVGLAVS